MNRDCAQIVPDCFYFGHIFSPGGYTIVKSQHLSLEVSGALKNSPGTHFQWLISFSLLAQTDVLISTPPNGRFYENRPASIVRRVATLVYCVAPRFQILISAAISREQLGLGSFAAVPECGQESFLAFFLAFLPASQLPVKRTPPKVRCPSGRRVQVCPQRGRRYG